MEQAEPDPRMMVSILDALINTQMSITVPEIVFKGNNSLGARAHTHTHTHTHTHKGIDRSEGR